MKQRQRRKRAKMSEQETKNELPDVTIGYSLDDSHEESYQKHLESAMQIFLHHLHQGNITLVDCVRSNEDDGKIVPVISALIDYDGQQAILPLGTLFTQEDKPSETLVPVKTDPRKNV